MGVLISYIIIMPVLIIGSCALWSFVLKKTPLMSAATIRQGIITGLFFGIVAVVAAHSSDYVNAYYDDILLIGSAGMVSLCAGLFFSGSAGVVSAAMGSAYEVISYIVSSSEFGQLSDAIVTIAIGFCTLLISRHLLRSRRPSMTICVMSALGVSALNVVIYPIASLSVSEHLGRMSEYVIAPMYLINVIVIIGALLIVRKIVTGSFRTEKTGRNNMKMWRLSAIVGIVVLVVATFVAYVCISAVCRSNAAMELKAELDAAEAYITDYPNNLKEKAKKYVDYNPGNMIVADSDGNIISHTENGKDTLEKIGLYTTGEDSNNNLYEANIGGTDYLLMYRRVYDIVLIDTMEEELAYSFRESLLLLILSIEVLIAYVLIILLSLIIEKELIHNGEEINASLDRIMGRNSDKKDSGEYSITGYNVTEYMKGIVERIEGEMKFAGDIQKQSLPLSNATINGVAIKASVKPARQIGGDFYDYFLLDGNRIVFIVADVSGKGISAAMFMMRAKAAIRGVASLENEDIVSKVNDLLHEGNADEMFLTAWMGIIDPMTGLVQYVNAAQGNKIFRDAGGEYRLIEDDPEAPLGIRKGKKYTARTLRMKPGSRLFLYTDGVTDANNADGEMYGEERILKYLNENCRTANGDETFNVSREQLQAFMGTEEQFDDITLMTVDYFGQPEDFGYTSKVIKAADENLDEATDFINAALEPLGCSDGQLMEIDVAFEELFINIAHYAYPEATGDVQVEVSTDYGMATVRLTDSGLMFNPLRQRGPDNSVPLKEKKEGGLGITMVKTCMNYVDYKYENEKNIFTMIKLIH